MTNLSFYKEQAQKAVKRVEEVTDTAGALQHILSEAANKELFF